MSEVPLYIPTEWPLHPPALCYERRVVGIEAPMACKDARL